MKRTLTLIVSLAILSLANPTFAQTLYWDGGASNIATNGDGISQGGVGTWNATIQNWDQGSVPHIAWPGSADAYFGATGIAVGAGLVTVTVPIVANSLAVMATNYVFTDGGNTANTLTLGAITNSSAFTVSNNIVNSTTFTKAGAGSVSLLGTSPGLTGTLNVSAGTLQLGNNVSSSGPASFGDVTVAANATFRINAFGSSAYAQNISGAGSFYAQANSSSSSITLSGVNTFAGNVTINQATLTVFSISDTVGSGLGMGTNLTIAAGGSASGLTYSGYGDTTSRTITLGGTTPTTIINASGYGPLVLLGPLAFGNANKHTLTLSGTASYLNLFGGTIPDNAATTNTALIKSGTSLWMLTGTNTYSGGTTLLSTGTLLITNDYALGAATGAVNFGGSSILRAVSNNVTLGAGRTVTVSNTYTANFGVWDTNNLIVASFITGPGSVTKAGSSYAQGWVRFGNDTNNYTGDFGVSYGNTEFTSVADQGVPSSLGQGAAASGGRITIGNNTSVGTLRYVGTGNSATHRPLNWTATTGGYTLDNTNTGTIAYLATTQMVNAAGSKMLALTGSNTGTNTLAQVINDNGGTTSLSKSGVGRWIVSGANTYSGPTTISSGTLSVGSDSNLGTAPVSATPNSLVISVGALSASASFALNANRGIALGPTGTNALGANAAGSGNMDVAASQTLTYGGILANTTATNTGGLVKTGAGTLALSGVSTYSGDTRINAGTLALGGSGSIAGSSNIIIAPGATLDVSGVGGGYTLAASQALLVTNTATAAINGSLNFGAASLVMANAPGTPTITVTGGTLALAGVNACTVNVKNGGSPLGAGSYKLIAKGTGGSVGGTAPATVTVGGDGLASGATAVVSIADGELYLVVSAGVLYPPVVESFGLVGGGVVLSFSGTNGQAWTILTSTNATLPLANWDVVTNGTFAGVPVSYTNTSPVDPQRYYRIACP